MTKESLAKLFNREVRDSNDNWKMKCPFHADGMERTPSFYVHKDEYIAHCFGCGIAGPIDSLGARYLLCEVAVVRQMLGITVAERVQRRITKRLEPPKPVKIPESWLAPLRKEIHDYTTTRGFTNQTLIRAETRYDRDKQRQVFPWRTPDRVLRGATGRTTSDNPAKWLHYWNDIFDKGKWLYELPPIVRSEGYDARSNERCVLTQGEIQLLVVEGIFDLLWVYQKTGIEHVVAPIAARLTFEQAQQVKERTDSVIIGFDNDEAGIRGSAVAYQQLRRACRVYFMDWRDGEKDWMDLDEQTIRERLSRPLTWPQWAQRIRGAGQESLIAYRTGARSKERELR